MRERALDAGYGAGWRLVRALPAPVALAAFEGCATLSAALRGGTGAVAQLRRNLARVRPAASEDELDELVRAALRSYARYWCEAFRLPSMDHDALRAVVGPSIEGQEHIEAALDAGRGMIVALPHSGNWDVAGMWLAGRLGSFATVVERLRPESLYRRFVAYRESLGFEILPLTGGQRPVGEVLARRLRDNGAVCLVADRDLGAGGVRVSFFGEPAKLPVGPARLAERTGAALLPASLWFTPTGWGCRVHPPVVAPSVLAATQAVADTFAAGIAEHPQDWHMLQPVWLADRPAPHQARRGVSRDRERVE
ncbi:MAG TPA: phosphatidylinositol mannoside acyltransferase [Pseudonocardiaceae bacterium]